MEKTKIKTPEKPYSMLTTEKDGSLWYSFNNRSTLRIARREGDKDEGKIANPVYGSLPKYREGPAFRAVVLFDDKSAGVIMGRSDLSMLLKKAGVKTPKGLEGKEVTIYHKGGFCHGFHMK